MKNEEYVDKLFGLAREQNVLLNTDEIQGLMDSKKNSPNQKSNPKKIKAMTITTIILAVTATIGLLVNSNKRSYHKMPADIINTAFEPFKGSTRDIEEQDPVQVAPQPILEAPDLKVVTDDTGKRKKVIVERKMIISDENIIMDGKSGDGSMAIFWDDRDTGKMDKENNISFKYITSEGEEQHEFENSIAPGFEKESFVQLNNEELKKVGIFIKNGVLMYEMDDTKVGDIKGFIGEKNTEQSMSISSKKLINGNNPYVMMVTLLNGEIIMANRDRADLRRNAGSYLPIWVEDEKSEHKKVYIVWYEMSKNLVSRFPLDIQANLQMNNEYYKHLLPDPKVAKYKIQVDSNDRIRRTHKGNGAVLIDDAQIIIPDEALLKNLGFKSLDPVKFYRKVDGEDLDITLSDVRQDINSNKNGTFKEGITLNTLFPAFLSRYSSQGNSVTGLSCFIKYPSAQRISPLQLFEVKKFGLLGFKVKSGLIDYIFWYEPTEALLKELKFEEREKIEEFISTNKDNLNKIGINVNLPTEKSFEDIVRGENSNTSGIKAITLTEEQLSKLYISTRDHKIIQVIPTDIHSNAKNVSALQLAFDKTGTEIKTLQLENFDKAKYVPPVITTDDIGLYARTYDETKMYDLEKINSYNLIPVLVRSGADYTTMDELTKRHRPDMIFWYEASEQFLNILDEKTSKEIRNDVAALNCNRTKITFTPLASCDENAPLSCNYFEACQNKVDMAINKYLVYPNPAKDKFNLKLELKENCTVSLSLLTLKGDEVKMVELGKMEAGINEKEVLTDNIAAGLYLLKVTTDKGDIFNERLLISR